MARVVIKKDEPKIAPIPIFVPIFMSPPKMYAPIIATRGTIVSGNAVPIAAKIEPTAFVPILSEHPKFSIAFVKMLQIKTIKNKRNKAIIKCKTTSILIFSKTLFYDIL